MPLLFISTELLYPSVTSLLDLFCKKMLFSQALTLAALCFVDAVSALKTKPGNAVVHYHGAVNSALRKRAEPVKYYDGPVITPKVFILSLVSWSVYARASSESYTNRHAVCLRGKCMAH